LRLAGRRDALPFQYCYEVDGRSHAGTLATLQSGAAARRAAAAALAAQRPGDTITVFYDRDHPSRSVIDGRAPAVLVWARFGWPVSLVVLVAGIVMMIAGY